MTTRFFRLAPLIAVLLAAAAPPLAAAQKLDPVPLAHTLRVGDTARTTATVIGPDGPIASATLTFSSDSAAIFTAHRDGKVTARAVGCAWQRVSYGAIASGRVRVCVEAVAPAPPPTPDPAPAFAFASDWPHALGSTREAVTDGGKWPVLACDRTYPTVLTVVDGASIGFSGRVLRLQQRGPDACGMLQVNDVVPASTTHWGRFYVRNDENGNSGDHPTGYNNAHWNGGAIQAVPWARESASHVTAGTWRITVGGGAPYPFRKWWGPALQNGRWYRYEWEMRYVSATRYQFWPRVYDDAGALVADADDFVQEDYQSPTRSVNLAQWYAAGNAGALGDPALARHFGIGHEGTSGAATLGYWYYARFALSLTGWVGR